MFSFPTDKWWENYWKFKVTSYTKGKQVSLVDAYVDFYFIEFRSRNRPLKN